MLPAAERALGKQLVLTDAVVDALPRLRALRDLRRLVILVGHVIHRLQVALTREVSSRRGWHGRCGGPAAGLDDGAPLRDRDASCHGFWARAALLIFGVCADALLAVRVGFSDHTRQERGSWETAAKKPLVLAINTFLRTTLNEESRSNRAPPHPPLLDLVRTTLNDRR